MAVAGRRAGGRAPVSASGPPLSADDLPLAPATTPRSARASPLPANVSPPPAEGPSPSADALPLLAESSQAPARRPPRELRRRWTGLVRKTLSQDQASTGGAQVSAPAGG